MLKPKTHGPRQSQSPEASDKRATLRDEPEHLSVTFSEAPSTENIRKPCARSSATAQRRMDVKTGHARVPHTSPRGSELLRHSVCPVSAKKQFPIDTATGKTPGQLQGRPRQNNGDTHTTAKRHSVHQRSVSITPHLSEPNQTTRS